MTQTVQRIFPAHKHHGGRLFLSLGHSGFGFVSDFDIRIWGFDGDTAFQGIAAET